jgi:Na+-transporting NADH:ubiquinone oxidoreductase subunit NqrE
MLSFDVHWWAVLAAVVVSMALGSLWYSKLLFGEMWMHGIGKKMEDMRGNGGPGYAYTTLAALVQAFVLANLVRDTGSTTALDGLTLGLMVWLGFVVASTLSETVFAARPWRNWQINIGFYLVVLAINGVILAVWR